MILLDPKTHIFFFFFEGKNSNFLFSVDDKINNIE